MGDRCINDAVWSHPIPELTSMDFNQIRYFLALAETLHFGRASRAVGMAQPHLSRAIARLEDELDVRLFERTSRRVVLTAAGLAFREEALAIVNAEERARQFARQAARKAGNRLRIAFVSAALYHILPAAIRQLRQVNPQADFDLHEATTNEQVEMISAGRIDLGLGHPPVETQPRLSVEILSKDRFDAVLPEDHPLSAERQIGFVQLAKEPMILFPEEQGLSLYAAIRDQCRLAGHSLTVAATAGRLHSQLSFVAAGLGIGLAPVQSRSIDIAGIVRRRIEPYPASLTLSLAALYDPRNRSPALRDALNILKDVAAPDGQADQS